MHQSGILLYKVHVQYTNNLNIVTFNNASFYQIETTTTHLKSQGTKNLFNENKNIFNIIGV